MAPAPAPLGPQSHLATAAGSARPRTTSINTDPAQLQVQQDDSFQVTSPATEALDQLMSNLAHHHQNQQSQQRQQSQQQQQYQQQQQQQQQHRAHGAPPLPLQPTHAHPASSPSFSTTHSSNGHSSSNFTSSSTSSRPLHPFTASSLSPSQGHSRQHSQTTVVGSNSNTPSSEHYQHLQLHRSGSQPPLDPTPTDSGPYSHQQDSLRSMSHHKSTTTPPSSGGLGSGNPGSHHHALNSSSNNYSHSQHHNHSHSSSSNVYGHASASSTGSNPNLALANSSGSLNTLVGNSPLQHRPHTPLKSSFPLSISSDQPSDPLTMPPSSPLSSNVHIGEAGGGGGGGGGAGGSRGPAGGGPSSLTSSSSAAGVSFDTLSTAPTPSLFRSLSTKSGRKQLMNNEKHLGSLPTIHHQSGRGRPEGATFLGVSMKHLSLLVLLLQNSVLVLMMRYSRVSVDPEKPMYLASTAVFIAEIIKLCTCFSILVYKTQSIPQTIHIIRREILEQPQEILKMLVPSGLYALQNNLLYIALSNLEAATFQVTYQMKILSTAIFSVVMLNRKLTRQKWLSLCLLMLGVTLVQLQNVGTPKSPMIMENNDEEFDPEFLDPAARESLSEAASHLEGGSGLDEDEAISGQNPIIGLLAVLTSCVSSGFAGCYFEKILKGSEADMWVRNLQLGISGSLFSFLAMFYDRQRIYEGGIFQGYSTITWLVITNQALGGLLVAIVVKYADNILKGFATSLSIIISGMISVYFFDFEPSFQFQLGTLVVILSTFLYGRPDAPIPRFIRPQKKRQSMPPPLKYA
ncbi:hypothetical protein BGZ72_008533 [Mortierella alpina]|nr:hypothetical protein BGZ72_008533 [Mortierella alpina]